MKKIIKDISYWVFVVGFCVCWGCLVVLVLFNTGCSHLTKDNYSNHALQSFHRIEFDVHQNGKTTKQIGIANFNIKENDPIGARYIAIYGVFKGTMYLKSNGCNIDVVRRFNGVEKFFIDEWLSQPTKCEIRVTMETDKLKDRQHNIVESGIIKINVIKNGEFVKINNQIGQSSTQKRAGALMQKDHFTLESKAKTGFFLIEGCGHELNGEFDTNKFNVSFFDLYKTNELKQTDSCDFEILLIPNELANSFYGRFSVNIYGKTTMKQPPVDWHVKKDILGKKKLHITGEQYTIATSINFGFKISNKMKTGYSKNKTYWLRSITRNGRKSIIAIKNNKQIWGE